MHVVVPFDAVDLAWRFNQQFYLLGTKKIYSGDNQDTWGSWSSTRSHTLPRCPPISRWTSRQGGVHDCGSCSDLRFHDHWNGRVGSFAEKSKMRELGSENVASTEEKGEEGKKGAAIGGDMSKSWRSISDGILISSQKASCTRVSRYDRCLSHYYQLFSFRNLAPILKICIWDRLERIS